MEAKQASAEVATLADEVCGGGGAGPGSIRREFPRATDANDRVLGTELSGAISRGRIYGDVAEGSDDILAEVSFNGGSIAGQGFGAFNAWGVSLRVEGGAQDGVGKTMLGGTVSILKGKGADGSRVNGSVGKSFAYGAQRGRLFVQGSADSRFCIRLSGADVVLGRRAGGAARRLPRLRRRPRQREGLRLRVHDLGPRRRPRRHRPLGLRRDDTPIDTRNPVRAALHRFAEHPESPGPLGPSRRPAIDGPLAVQVLRTYPARRHAYPFAPDGERSIARPTSRRSGAPDASSTSKTSTCGRSTPRACCGTHSRAIPSS